MPRTAARISRSSSVGISSRRAMRPGSLFLSGVALRQVQLGLHGLSLVAPAEALLEIRDRRLRVPGAVQRLAQVEEGVGVVDVGAVLRPRGHRVLQDRHRAGIVALLHQREALLVQGGALLGVERALLLLGGRGLWLLGRRIRLGRGLLLLLLLLLLPGLLPLLIASVRLLL